MKIIGLTGPSGSGKSSLCTILARHGVFCINTDKVYHNLLVPPSACLDEIAERFGSSVIAADGTLDRRALAAVVFAPGAEDELAALNSISHLHILGKVRSLISDFSGGMCPAVAVDAPALIESGFNRECDTVVAVLANRQIRIERIMARDGLSYSEATARVNAQKSDDFYIQNAETVIYNNTGTEELAAQAAEFLSKLGITV